MLQDGSQTRREEYDEFLVYLVGAMTAVIWVVQISVDITVAAIVGVFGIASVAAIGSSVRISLCIAWSSVPSCNFKSLSPTNSVEDLKFVEFFSVIPPLPMIISLFFADCPSEKCRRGKEREICNEVIFLGKNSFSRHALATQTYFNY